MKQLIINNSFSESLHQILKEHNLKKIFIFTGIRNAKRLKNSKIMENYHYDIFTEFDKNPDVRDVNKAKDLINAYNPDVILAVGGGSTIDIAKQTNVLAAQTNSLMFTEQSLSKDISENNLNIKNNGLPLIAIPTTAGTGSESTQFSVIYINKRKYSIDDPKLLPNFVILDSSFLNGSPTELIATTGMDALTQSIESLWSVNSTEQSRGYATEAIKIIRDTLEEAYISGYDSGDSGEVMLKAANLSGKAINITRTTAPHAISYPLTIHFKIPHGHAVALTLSKFFEINSQTNKYKINDLRGKTHVDSIMKYIFSLFLASSAKECSKNFNKLMDTIGLERNFNKLGIESKADIKKITDNIDPNRIKNNPVEIDKETVENILNN